jgi:hypothetical protein
MAWRTAWLVVVDVDAIELASAIDLGVVVAMVI